MILLLWQSSRICASHCAHWNHAQIWQRVPSRPADLMGEGQGEAGGGGLGELFLGEKYFLVLTPWPRGPPF